MTIEKLKLDDRGFPRLKRDWEGMRVISTEVISNGYGRMPAGTIFTVKSAHCKLQLLSDSCPECGSIYSVARVGHDSVELIKDVAVSPFPVDIENIQHNADIGKSNRGYKNRINKIIIQG